MAGVEALVFENPLPGIEPRRVRAAIGSPVSEIVAGCKAPMVCIIDGRPLARDYWMQRDVCDGDRIEFHPVFLGGGGGSRGILGAIASLALSAFMPGFVAGLSPALFGTATALTNLGRLVVAGLVMLGNALISAILPAGNRSGSNQGDKASSVYDVDTQGNQAKIFNPIPVQYGRMKAFPDYAAQPYVRYLTDTNPDGDQYYYALFCLGHGEYEVDDILIGDAPINSFSDVLTARILPPGERPAEVNACVVTSEAVSGQSLDSGEFVGGFPACGPGRRCNRISLDIVFPQGLCRLDSKGKAKENAVTIYVEIAPLSDTGKQQGNWREMVIQTISAASLTPQRRTIDIEVERGRYAVRVRRGGKRDTEDNQSMTMSQWQALRSELVDDAPLCPTATHFELIMRASDQLSSLSQRKIAIICTRKVKDFAGNIVPSRSPILALLDKWTNTDYGDGLPLSRIDIPTLQKYYQVAAERQDRFDYRFESRVTSEEADQLIAKVHRCVVLQRQGVKTLVRDELAELPITLFSPTNTTEGSVSIDYVQVTEETADGVIAEYFSRATWQWEEEECPAPGHTYTTATHPGYNPALPPMESPVRVRLEGIIGRKHAIREGMYYAATNALRRQFIAWQTELQGALVYYGAPVIFTSTLYNSQTGGEVVDFREEDGALRIDADIMAGSRLIFMRADGSVTSPLSFTALGDGWIKVDGEAPASFGEYNRERTRFAAVSGELIRRIVKITAVEPRGMGNTGAPEYQLRGVVDVPEVHTIDNPWLPREGEIQDVDEGGSGLQDWVVLFSDYVVTTEVAQYKGAGYPATVILRNNGTTSLMYYTRRGGVTETPAQAWLSLSPVDGAGWYYEVAVAFTLPDERLYQFLWTEGDAPTSRNMIMPGHKCHVRADDLHGIDDGSAYLVKEMQRLGRSGIIVSDWTAIGTDLYIAGSFENLGIAPDGTPLECRKIDGIYGIRDRYTKVLQGTGSFSLQIGA